MLFYVVYMLFYVAYIVFYVAYMLFRVVYVLFTCCFMLFVDMLFHVVYVTLCYDSEEEDEIVECDGCGVTVHEGMYTHIQGGAWLYGSGSNVNIRGWM